MLSGNALHDAKLSGVVSVSDLSLANLFKPRSKTQIQ